MATKIESVLEKDEILELYLNTSYFGSGYSTIKEASLGYFSKETKYMTKEGMQPISRHFKGSLCV